jgi:DNA-binding PadR family transcriptional regulator
MTPRGRAPAVNATAAALLGLLHDGPMTGGQLVSAADGRFGAFFSVTRSQVYRELPVLAESGLLKLGEQGPRASQQYVITSAGQRAEIVRCNREAFGARLASARSAARAEADPYRRAVADFAVAHNRAMVKLLDAIPLD